LALWLCIIARSALSAYCGELQYAEFERDILRDRVKAGIDQARKDGKPHGRPMTPGKLVPEMKQLRKDGISKRAIAKQLGVSRTSVIRLLRSRKRA
jgi:DNA invertase Pin-like site-specific DNA recombinase